MSPEAVCTWISNVSSPSAGPSEGLSRLETTPEAVVRSNLAAVPSTTPTPTSPLLVARRDRAPHCGRDGQRSRRGLRADAAA